jgi:hypothetical protein
MNRSKWAALLVDEASARNARPNLTTRSIVIMSNITARIAVAVVLAATPIASFARSAGEAGTGNLSISGIPSGPANVGGLNNVYADPSGIGNAARMPALPSPHISVPQIPQFR